MDLAIKRIYDDVSGSDGYRVLVDRLWPRGMATGRAELDEWIKDLGPSTELRKWFGHDVTRWEEFRERYRAELVDAEPLWRPLVDRAATERVCLLFGAKDTEHNQAVVLRDFLLEQG